jgi:hypothetical protein
LHDEILGSVAEGLVSPRGLLHTLGLDDSMYVSITGEVCLPMVFCALLVPCALVGACAVPFYLVYLSVVSLWRMVVVEERFASGDRVVRWRQVKCLRGKGYEKACTIIFSVAVIIFSVSTVVILYWDIGCWTNELNTKSVHGIGLSTWNYLSKPPFSVWLGMSAYECFMLVEYVMAHLVFEFFDNDFGAEMDRFQRSGSREDDWMEKLLTNRSLNSVVLPQPLPFSRRSLRHIIKTLNTAFVMDQAHYRTGNLFPDLVMLNSVEDEDSDDSSSSSDIEQGCSVDSDYNSEGPDDGRLPERMHAVTVRWEAQQESREKAACRPAISLPSPKRKSCEIPWRIASEKFQYICVYI